MPPYEANMLRIREECSPSEVAMPPYEANILRNSSVSVDNIEMRRLGQATRIARYPVHWHLAADVRGSSLTNVSIRDSYQRCVTQHGTWSATVEGTVCYSTYGHAFYFEDGIEHNNTWRNNLVVQVRRGPMVCTDHQAGPSGFWITNPNNTLEDNLAVDVGSHEGGIGYWIISGGSISRESGPSYLSTDFWTEDYAAQHAGLIFNPSRRVFGNDSSIAPWVLKQQQGRTPLKSFVGNGVRSSHRGVHVDGFITSSVPGEIGEHLHPSEEISIFSDPKEGTCNYFPAGNSAIPSVEGLHVYAPVDFTYDGDGNARNYSAVYSVLDRLHISRCDDTWWSRAARLNITNAVFAHNWIGMTNHIPGGNWCPHDAVTENPGLANHVTNSLYIGHGDDEINAQLCEHGSAMQGSAESPAGIRQYDGAFWLSGSRWVNMSAIDCKPPTNQSSASPAPMKSLPFSLVAARQEDCNSKFPIQLRLSWPLGSSDADAAGPWGWAVRHEDTAHTENLIELSGESICGFSTGGVVDMTGTLDPQHPTNSTQGFYASDNHPVDPRELARYSVAELAQKHQYGMIASTARNSKVRSAGYYFTAKRDVDYAHTCSYCNYDVPRSCPTGPPGAPPAPAPPAPPPAPSPPDPPGPPAPPLPPGGFRNWNVTTCQVGAIKHKVVEKKGAVLQGSVHGVPESLPSYCNDCVGRCFLQQKGSCAGVSYAAGKCTFYSAVTGATAAPSGDISAVLISGGGPSPSPPPGPPPAPTPSPPSPSPPAPAPVPVPSNWTSLPGVAIAAGAVKFANASLAELVSSACTGLHLEPNCGTGPPGVASATTGCPQSQRAGCVTGGAVHEYWCHPPKSAGSDGTDPITQQPQVVDDEPLDPGALCRQHCEDWPRYNRVNHGSNPPRLSDCHVSWGCTAWTWDPSAAGGTCFWHMFTPAQVGRSSWPTAPCKGCASGAMLPE